jgi:hypothetical protein
VLGEVIERGVDGGGVDGGGVDGGGVDGGGVFEGAMVILRLAETDRPPAPVTATVSVLVPALAGVPDKTPDLVKPRPVLQAPEQLLIVQV